MFVGFAVSVDADANPAEFVLDNQTAPFLQLDTRTGTRRRNRLKAIFINSIPRRHSRNQEMDIASGEETALAISPEAPGYTALERSTP